MEMQPMMAPDPNAILNMCRDIDASIDQVGDRLRNLEGMLDQFVKDPNSAEISKSLQMEGDDIMKDYRALAGRVKKIKSMHDSGNPRNAPQVGRVDRRLKKAINEYQQIDSNFRRKARDASIRQLRIVRPDATEQEIMEAAEDTNAPIFQQALMQYDRRGKSQGALSNVQARHKAIQQIARTMEELAEMFQDLDRIVMEQEPMVANIEQKGEEVHENVVKANTEIGGAIEKARSRNRKKWWCLGITILIIIIIVIIAIIVVKTRPT